VDNGTDRHSSRTVPWNYLPDAQTTRWYRALTRTTLSWMVEVDTFAPMTIFPRAVTRGRCWTWVYLVVFHSSILSNAR
jgi:hypothetical protein